MSTHVPGFKSLFNFFPFACKNEVVLSEYADVECAIGQFSPK